MPKLLVLILCPVVFSTGLNKKMNTKSLTPCQLHWGQENISLYSSIFYL